MGNADWWAQSQAPQTTEQKFHAQKAAQIEREWEVEAQAVELERAKRKKSAYSQLMIAGVALVVGLGAWLSSDLGPYQGIIFAVAFLFGYAGFRQLIRSV